MLTKKDSSQSLLKTVFHFVTFKVFVPIFGNLRLAAVGEWNRIGKKLFIILKPFYCFMITFYYFDVQFVIELWHLQLKNKKNRIGFRIKSKFLGYQTRIWAYFNTTKKYIINWILRRTNSSNMHII